LYTTRTINTESGAISSSQGNKPALHKMWRFLHVYLNLPYVITSDVIYLTIGQTFFGIVKYAPFIWLCKLLRKPYILHIHGGYLNRSFSEMSPRRRAIVLSIVEGSTTLIALSKSLQQQLQCVFPKANVEVVENFYDARLLTPLPKKSWSVDVPEIIYLSNLMLGKGILELLDALLILKQKGVPFNISVAGGIEKGIESQVHHRIRLLGDNVQFFGLADFEQKKILLSRSQLFVLPTWYIMEGQPLSIIEAYVTGHVVLSTHQGGIIDVANYPGFVKVAPQNVGALAEHIASVLSQLPEWQAAVDATQAASIERFHPDRFIQQMEFIFSNAYLKNSPEKISVESRTTSEVTSGGVMVSR
jgi:glycosyltransferase involved in cell wall biosynthesis